MSAECDKCGTDMVWDDKYDGTMYCPVCKVQAKLDRLLAAARAVVKECREDEGLLAWWQESDALDALQQAVAECEEGLE